LEDPLSLPELSGYGLKKNKSYLAPRIRSEIPRCHGLEELAASDGLFTKGRIAGTLQNAEAFSHPSPASIQDTSQSSSASNQIETSWGVDVHDSDDRSLGNDSSDENRRFLAGPGNTKTENPPKTSLDTTQASTNPSDTVLDELTPVNFEASDVSLTSPVSSPSPASSPNSSIYAEMDGTLGPMALRLVTTMVRELMQQVLPMVTGAWTSTRAPNSNGHSNQQASTSSAQSLATGSNSQPESTKRTRDDDKNPGDGGESSSEDDDNDDRRRRKKGKGNIDRVPHLGLRCPFYLRDPEKYAQIQACSSGRGFADMSRLRYYAYMKMIKHH
jgi:hypothetical protein